MFKSSLKTPFSNNLADVLESVDLLESNENAMMYKHVADGEEKGSSLLLLNQTGEKSNHAIWNGCS